MTTQTNYTPVKWTVEYKAPGGEWTILAVDSAEPDTINGFLSKTAGSDGSITRSYQSPQGALGHWEIRVSFEPVPNQVFVEEYYDPNLGRPVGHYDTVMVQPTVNSIQGQSLSLTQTATITGKTTSRYLRSFRIPLEAPGPWDIKVTRETADSTSSYLVNETWWDSMKTVVESKLSYPNSAYYAITLDAEQFDSVPTRGYDVYGLLIKVPSNYDPVGRTYDGVWDGTFKLAWSNNPAWVYYDLVTEDRYGLGDLIDPNMIDKWGLYAIGYYCDGKCLSGYGYVEPRFTCNTYIQTRDDAYKLLASLTSVFRGMAYWGAGGVTAVCDRPSDAAYLFTNANVIDGEFSYAGTSRATRNTVALVTWNNPANMYRQEVEYVEDAEGIARYGINEAELAAFGCTSRGQAHRAGKWLLYTNQYESETVAFKTGLESVTVYPGALILVADILRSGERIGGRLLDATTTQLTLDSPVTLASGVTYQIAVVKPSGYCTLRAVTNSAGEHSVITVDTEYYEAPLQHAIWILCTENLNPQWFRVLSVAEGDPGQADIVAVAHNPSKYGYVEAGQELQELSISSIRGAAPDPVTDITFTETLYKQAPGVFASKLHVSWSSGATRFNLRYQIDDNNPVTDATDVTGYDISPVPPSTAKVQVQAVDSLGRTSVWVEAVYGVQGQTTPPATVTGFTATTDSTGTILSWNASPEIDVNRYELREGASWDTATTLTVVFATSYRVGLKGENTTYLIKAIDTSDNMSVNAASTTVIISPPAAPTLTLEGGLFCVNLAWTFGDSRKDLRGTEIWWSATNDRSTASRLTYAPFPDTAFSHIGLEPGDDGYYWARVGDMFDNFSAWYPLSATGGLYGASETDPTSLLTQLQNALGMGQLAAELATPIGLISAADTVSGSVNARIKAAQDTLQAQINELSGTPTYDAGTTYAIDDVVQYDGGLYKATQATTGNLPTNTTYWTKIGDYTSLADAVAGQAAQINAINTVSAGSTSAAAQAIAGLQADMTAAEGTISTHSTQISNRYTKAETDSAISSSSTTLTAAYQAADTSTLNSAKGYSDAAILTEQTTRANADTALSNRTTALEASVNNASTGLATKASIAYVDQAEADAVATSANSIAQVSARLDTGDYAAVKTSASASASKITGLEAKYVLQVDAGGKVAGMALASGAGGTAITMLADKFLFYQPDGGGTGKQVFSIGTVNGVTALGFDGSAIFDGSIVARHVATGSLTADKIDTRGLTIKDASGNVILGSGTGLPSSYLSAGVSGNMIPNSDFSAGIQNWAVSWNQGGGTAYSAPVWDLAAPDWAPAGGHQIGFVRNGTTGAASGWFDITLDRNITCLPSTRYEVSAYLAAHRCSAYFCVGFYKLVNNVLTYITESSFGPMTASGGQTLSNWGRVGGFVTTPSDCQFMRVWVRGGVATASDPYVWGTRLFLGQAGANQNELSPWSPAGATGAFSELNKITAANISTYIASAAIDYAQIKDAAITTAKIGQAQIDTLRVAGNAITVPISVSHGTSGDVTSASADFAGGAVHLTVGAYLNASVTDASIMEIRIYRDGGLIRSQSFKLFVVGGYTWESGSETYFMGGGTLAHLDFPGGGSHYYRAKAYINAGGPSININLMALGVKR